MLEEFARETSAAESWSPSTRRTLSIGSRAQLAGGAAENLCERWVCGLVHTVLAIGHSRPGSGSLAISAEGVGGGWTSVHRVDGHH